MVGPCATAIESAWCGIPRLAFIEPSIGSTITFTSGSPKSTTPRSSLTAQNRAPSPYRRSSSSNTARSAAASISSVRSPPSPREPVSTTRWAIVGRSASMALITSAARRAAASQSGLIRRLS
jgi:hypothetical protein